MYHYDYHDARGHQDRRIARRVALGEPVEDPTPDHVWLDQDPEEMAAEALAGFPVRFEWALDDLRALFTGRPAIAERWGLRPELAAPLLDSLRRMVVLVPTEDFRQHQLRTLPRVGTLNVPVTDPAHSRPTVSSVTGWSPSAAQNARRLGTRVIEVDGTLDAVAVAAEVGEHFAPYLGAATAA